MEKRQSAAPKAFGVAFWSAVVLCRFSVRTLTLHRRDGRCYDSDVSLLRTA
jgi:hypothetical protein